MFATRKQEAIKKDTTHKNYTCSPQLGLHSASMYTYKISTKTKHSYN